MINIQNTILGKIVDRKHEELTARLKQRSLHDVEQWAKEATPVRGFANALQHKRPAVIAEIKKASPSKGIIRADFDPAEIAQQYEQAGAACLSVLTDVDFFHGADKNIAIARNQCALPALRKDFLIDPYNVVEARALQAFEHQLDVLVEVHDEAELERALKLSEQCILGVNNRNLKTFDVDLNTSLRLKKLLPSSRVLVTESGISTPADVEIMQANDIHTFLVGESFMKQPRPDQAFNELFGQPQRI